MISSETNTKAYFDVIARLSDSILVTDKEFNELSLDASITSFIQRAKVVHASGNKLMFIGNGGSSTIASHMAEDYTKAGGIRALAFNDPAFLTCLGNDLGYEQVFSAQIDMFAQPGDILIAISSSGNSENILKAVDSARKKRCWILTLSGFLPDNSLRILGDCNIYVPSQEYGFVEISHLAICHSALDFALGWIANRGQKKPELRVATA